MTALRYQPTSTPHVYRSVARGQDRFYVRMPKNEKGVRPYVRAVSLKDAQKLAARAHTLGEAAPDRTWTMTKLVESWRAERAPKLKPRTRETYERVIVNRILPAWHRHPVRNIRRADVVAWLDGMERKDGKPGALDDGTRALAYAVLRALFQHALMHDALTVMPQLPRGTKPRQGKGRERILTEAEEDLLLAAVEGGRRAWLAPIIEVALGQALRLGEVCGLQWGDVDFDAGTMTVAHNLGKDGTMGTPKGGDPKTITLTDRTSAVLKEHRMAQGRPADGHVFTNTLRGARQPRDVQRAIEQAAERAGLEGVSMHCLRHTRISRLGEDPEMTVVALCAFARHESITTTQKYMHYTKDATTINAIRRSA